MPLREFICEKCSSRFEELVAGDDLPECPSCGGRRLKRLLSTFAVAVGSGSSRSTAVSENASPGPCGSCGDPRGAGACEIED